MNPTAKVRLIVRLCAQGVQLTCPHCGLVLRQARRDPVAARCPKCGAVWR